MEQFRIEGKLGRGPVGTSYAGTLVADGAPVVAKVLTSRFEQHPQVLRQVLQDLRAWDGFRHDKVVATLGVGEQQGRHVVLYERAAGRPVEQLLTEGGALEPRLASLVVRDVCLALAVAHQGDLPVGDVRAAKVYFDGHGARLADLGQHRASCLSAGFGSVGMTFGHPAYLAPEVLQQGIRSPTPGADVYALGILFYELLAGELPFAGEPREQLRHHLATPLPPPPAAIAGNQALRGVLARMTAKDPGKRFSHAQAVLEALYEMVGRRPPLQDVAPMNTTVWRQAAEQDARERSDEWSSERVQNARPVGPDLSERRDTTGRLPKQLDSGAGPAGAEAPVGGVRLTEKLGRGTVGTSYAGELAHYSGGVVVKVLSSKFAKHPELHERILARMERACGLAAPNVVGVFRVMKASGRDVFVFERSEGRCLREVLRQRKTLPVDQALAWVKELAAGLTLGQRRELSHGDIRPEKVFVDDRGRARLADFGLAEAACLGAGFGQYGLPFGHPTYLAPEVVQEEQREPEPAGDAYALGILLYELVCGVPPFRADSPRKTLLLHLESPLPPPRGVKLPQVVAELVMRLTAKDPRRRPQDAAALVEEIARCQKQVRLAGSAEIEDVDEFDPTSLGETGQAADVWKSAEQELTAKPGQGWRESRIETAPKVGPEGWEPGAEMFQSEELEPPRSPLDLP